MGRHRRKHGSLWPPDVSRAERWGWYLLMPGIVTGSLAVLLVEDALNGRWGRGGAAAVAVVAGAHAVGGILLWRANRRARAARDTTPES